MKNYFLFLVLIFGLGLFSCKNANQPAPNPSASQPSVSQPSPAEATYKILLSVVKSPEVPKGKKLTEEEQQALAEAGSDVGFYMMQIQDSFQNKDIVIQNVPDSLNLANVELKDNTGKVVAKIDLSKFAAADGTLSGFVCAQNGKEPKFVSLKAEEGNVEEIRAYFK